MGKNLNLMAFDLGASNGRAILGEFNGDTVKLSELYRFANGITDIHGVAYWDAIKLYRKMVKAFTVAKQEGKHVDCFGIDTWGVDFGLLDKNGAPIGEVRAYRDMTDADMEECWKTVDKKEIFNRTGISHYSFNTLYQLCKRVRNNDVALANADKLLMFPDLLGYFLSGDKRTEYTHATTSQMINYKTKDWDRELLQKFNIPTNILPEIVKAGNLRGELCKSIADELGLGYQPKFAAVGEHDTASAVAAIPGEGSFAFCSSGTWSLFGVETPEAVINDFVIEANFSNEGTVQGGCRPLGNIMGMWIIQECRRNWINEGKDYSWDDIVKLALKEKPLVSIINPDYADFFNAGNMPEKIREFCKKTNQTVPENDGQIARCVYESVALKYKWALEQLEKIKGEKIDSLNIVGGGINNKFLNQCAADATERRVITGPVEGAAIGNILLQAQAMGELNGIDEVREVVRRSEKPEIYEPHTNDQWKEAYSKLLELLEVK